ncbi:hypothetical protein [Pseudonocardia sp. GCM10023141]|uniref:hypothetical protein n=1 Tax=Pseudonocardia sp. GCM10023141 TaxID=3252653 RepID=UPI003620EBFB
MTVALCGRRPLRAAFAGLGVAACLLMLTLSALMGFVGHTTVSQAAHDQSTVSAGHAAYRVATDVAVALDHEGLDAAHGGDSADPHLHWEHDSLTAWGVSAPSAGLLAAAFVPGAPVDASLTAVRGILIGSVRLSAPAYLLCVLRT